jgi:hypothetical protein
MNNNNNNNNNNIDNIKVGYLITVKGKNNDNINHRGILIKMLATMQQQLLQASKI